MRDCGPNLSAAAIHEFLSLWVGLREVQLDTGSEDKLVWRWESNSRYSSRSAYRAFFAGKTLAAGADQVWKSRAPHGCRFFAWLVAKNRCWTGDRLLMRGLPHPAACPMCDQEPETLQHLLLGCVVAREVWTRVVTFWNKPGWVPDMDSEILAWWTERRAGSQDRRDLWTAITLVFWCQWRHRNDVVFNAARPSAQTVLQMVRKEFAAWKLAGLFRGEAFGFPQPIPQWLLDGD